MKYIFVVVLYSCTYYVNTNNISVGVKNVGQLQMKIHSYYFVYLIEKIVYQFILFCIYTSIIICIQ